VNKIINASLEVLMIIKIQVTVFWIVVTVISWRWRQHGPPKHWYATASQPRKLWPRIVF